MPEIVSRLFDPPQPNTDNYSVTALYSVKLYTRASYKESFGVDPDTYDASKPTKPWFDSDAASKADADGKVTYTIVGKQGESTVKLSVADALKPNLYGIHTYPVFVPAPTTAYVHSVFSADKTLVPVRTLSTQAEAQALADAWFVKEAIYDGTPAKNQFAETVYPADEPRRQWMIPWKGSAVVAGMFVEEQNAAGVGAPGRWDLTGGEPNWISYLPTSLPDANPDGPIPCRSLKANEAVFATPFSFVIYRKDMPGVYNQAQGTPASSGSTCNFQAQTALTLNRIDRTVTAIWALVKPQE